jgi:hypothetical protein
MLSYFQMFNTHAAEHTHLKCVVGQSTQHVLTTPPGGRTPPAPRGHPWVLFREILPLSPGTLYHMFSNFDKWVLVCGVFVSGCFSPHTQFSGCAKAHIKLTILLTWSLQFSITNAFIIPCNRHHHPAPKLSSFPTETLYSSNTNSPYHPPPLPPDPGNRSATFCPHEFL